MIGVSLAAAVQPTKKWFTPGGIWILSAPQSGESMNRICYFYLTSLLLFILAFHQGSSARGLALGVVIGSPTGLSLGYTLDSAHALDGAIAWSRSQPMYLHFAYQWEPAAKFRVERADFNLYWGAGARLITNENRFGEQSTSIGGRFPLGVRYYWTHPSLSAFLELALNVDLVPESDVSFGALLGLRYVFN